MCHISAPPTKQNENALQTVKFFFNSFTIDEAIKLQHKMTRSAFSHKRNLDKRDVLDLLFIKEEMEKLINAAAILAKDKTTGNQLNKLFRKTKACEWIEWLDELFHAAVYDGFYTNPSTNTDVYYSCRGLLKIIKKCYAIHKQESTADIAVCEDRQQ